MTRIDTPRVYETSRILATKSGQELADFINYMTDFAERVIRALNGGLSFGDNFSSLVKTVSVRHLVEEIVATDGRQPAGVIPVRVVSSTAGLESFAWYVTDQGEVAVKAGLTGAPSSAFDIVLVILFA